MTGTVDEITGFGLRSGLELVCEMDVLFEIRGNF